LAALLVQAPNYSIYKAAYKQAKYQAKYYLSKHRQIIADVALMLFNTKKGLAASFSQVAVV
jgi:hypothetical protein